MRILMIFRKSFPNPKMNKAVDLSCYSDVLCIWSYVSEIRLDELRENLGEQVNINYHFITIFGCTEKRISEGWKDRGGYAGFADYVANVGKDFPHIELHQDIWRTIRPKTSANAHLFLKAVQLLELDKVISSSPVPEFKNKTLFEEIVWRTRCTFFRDCCDIGQLPVLYNLAETMGLPIDKIQARINDGSAIGALCCDNELREKHRLDGSPTYLLNNGRQKLYGNVGYRIIEANIEELLQRPEGMASWC